jgi:DDE superfamily endonuclease
MLRLAKVHIVLGGSPPVEHLTVSLAELLGEFRGCFARSESFAVFQPVVVAWVLCLRCRTLTEVWQLTGLGPKMHYDAIYSLFASANWDWDELGVLLCLLILAHLVPFGLVSVAVDDTPCHKRGKKVAFGGIFLDPVLSTRSRKVLRFGLNYVVVAVVVRLPFRPDRYFALPVLWRVFRKKGQEGHQKRTELAASLVRHLANAIPCRPFCLVADCAYINATVLADLPDNVVVIGPLPKKAALYLPAMPKVQGQRGAPRKKGLRLPTPAQLLEKPQMLEEVASKHGEEFALISSLNAEGWAARQEELVLPKVKKVLRVQTLRGVLWYHACKQKPVTVTLIHDPQEAKEGKWRDEVLVSTKVETGAAEMIAEYGKRWSVEVAFFDSKQFPGLEDPQVRAPLSVQRAHPTAWFCLSVVILWYALNREQIDKVKRERPWYKKTVGDTFTEMLGAMRLWLWQQRLFGEAQDRPVSVEMVENLLNEMAAVG